MNNIVNFPKEKIPPSEPQEGQEPIENVYDFGLCLFCNAMETGHMPNRLLELYKHKIGILEEDDEDDIYNEIKEIKDSLKLKADKQELLSVLYLVKAILAKFLGSP